MNVDLTSNGIFIDGITLKFWKGNSSYGDKEGRFLKVYKENVLITLIDLDKYRLSYFRSVSSANSKVYELVEKE